MKKKNYIMSLVLFFVLFLLTYAFVLKDYPYKDLFHAISLCDGKYLLLAAFFVLGYLLCTAIFNKRMCSIFGKKITWYQAFGYKFTEFYFSGITPSSLGGQPVEMIEMHKDGIGVQISGVLILLTTVLYMSTIVLLGTICFIFKRDILFSQGNLFKYTTILGYVTTILVVLMFLTMIYSPKIMRFLVKGVVKLLKIFHLPKVAKGIEDKMHTMLEEYHEIAVFTIKHPIVLLEGFIYMLGARIANLSIPFAIYHAFHLTGYSYFTIIALQVGITFGSDFFPFPGGVGINETLNLKANELLYGKSLSTPGMVMVRLFNFYGIMAIAFIYYMIFHLKKREKAITLKGERKDE